MGKKKEDFSITGAINSLNEMFFDIEETVKDATNVGTSKRVELADDKSDDESDKPESKRVGNTFIAKKAGSKDKRGESKTSKPEPTADDSTGDDTSEE